MTRILFLALLFSSYAMAGVEMAQTEMPETAKSKAHQENADVSHGAIKMARVFFVEPLDGATVPGTFKVKMGVEGMTLTPAGKKVNDVTAGHHHLIVDGKSLPKGQPIPANATNIHYGKAQTEAELTLAPGDHTLTLQFADGAHRSFGEKFSQTIKIHVKK